MRPGDRVRCLLINREEVDVSAQKKGLRTAFNRSVSVVLRSWATSVLFDAGVGPKCRNRVRGAGADSRFVTKLIQSWLGRFAPASGRDLRPADMSNAHVAGLDVRQRAWLEQGTAQSGMTANSFQGRRRYIDVGCDDFVSILL